LVYFPEFVLGMLLARQLRRGSAPRVPFPLAVCGAVVGYALHLAPVTPVAYGALILAAATADIDGRRTRLAGSRLVTLGRWSYAFYLVHGLLLSVVQHTVIAVGHGTHHRAPWDAVVVAIAFLVTLVASWLVFTYVERPFERRLRSPRTPRQARQRAHGTDALSTEHTAPTGFEGGKPAGPG